MSGSRLLFLAKDDTKTRRRSLESKLYSCLEVEAILVSGNALNAWALSRRQIPRWTVAHSVRQQRSPNPKSADRPSELAWLSREVGREGAMRDFRFEVVTHIVKTRCRIFFFADSRLIFAKSSPHHHHKLFTHLRLTPTWPCSDPLAFAFAFARRFSSLAILAPRSASIHPFLPSPPLSPSTRHLRRSIRLPS